MPLTYLIIGIILGGFPAAALAWVLAERRAKSKQAETATAFAIASETAQRVRKDHETALQLVEQLRHAHGAAEREKAGLAAELNAERRQAQAKGEDTARLLAELTEARALNAESRQQAAALAAQLGAERKSLIEQRESIEQTDVRLREAFSKLSEDALRQSRDAFLTLADQRFKTLHIQADGALEKRKTEIASLLQPVNQQLTEYRASLQQLEAARQTAYTDLKSHLTEVATTQQNLGRETSQLVQALRKPQGRGQWGELALRRLFEFAGLLQHVDFQEQLSVDNDGAKKRPDCVVNLPEGRQVVVDSKAVMDAFTDAAGCTDDGERTGHLRRHAGQVRSRVNELASKAYWDEFAASADYVVLFLPSEAFFFAAVEHDKDLIEYALRQKVILAAPMSLLGLLKVIEYGWRQKRIEENATEIRKQGEELYHRVATLAEHFDQLGTALTSATKTYNKTLASLENRVIPQARKMNELGVKGKKSLPDLVPVDTSVQERGPVWKEFSDNRVEEVVATLQPSVDEAHQE